MCVYDGNNVVAWDGVTAACSVLFCHQSWKIVWAGRATRRSGTRSMRLGVLSSKQKSDRNDSTNKISCRLNLPRIAAEVRAKISCVPQLEA